MRLIVAVLVITFVLLFGSTINAQQFPVNTIHYSGPMAINIVILGDGYTNAEIPLFRSDAQNVTNAFLNRAPFNQYSHYFNFYAIEVASQQSGASHPRNKTDCPPLTSEPVVTVNNYFGSTFDYGSVHRGLFAANVSAINHVLADNLPTYHFAMVIVNTPHWGGLNSSVGFPTSSRMNIDIPIHEFGHNFADLGDEYSDCCGTARERPNVTQEARRDAIKWRHLIQSTTPVPTTTSVGINTVGLFEGANYNTTGWFRPQVDCMMRNTGAQFCAVCQEAIVSRIQSLSICPTLDRSVTENFGSRTDNITIQRTGFRTINSTSIVYSGAKISFEAGINIQLQPGFQAHLGSTFNALIKACPVFPPPFPGATAARMSSAYETTNQEDENLEQLEDLTAYPNPTKDHITIAYKLSSTGPVQVYLSNIMGKTLVNVIDKVSQDSGKYTVDQSVESLVSGIYFCSLKTRHGIITKRIVVIKY